jgi:hypothetical protein
MEHASFGGAHGTYPRDGVIHGPGPRQMRPDLIAFATACAFVGAALYVNVVEQPLALDARSRKKRKSRARAFA